MATDRPLATLSTKSRDGEGASVFVRRSEQDDVTDILEIIGTQKHVYEERFGEFDVSTLIETGCLCVTAVDSAGQVVGFAAFNNHPNYHVEKIDPVDWQQWLHDNFGMWNVGTNNALWLSMFAADQLYASEVVHVVMKTYFVTLPKYECCLFALPAIVPIFAPIDDIFATAPASSSVHSVNLVVSKREDFIGKLNVRLARVEDHDDLVPIFNQQSEVLQERYGEFFLAELIEGQDEHDRALVAEYNGRAVGLMSFTSDVDIKVLRRCFKLDAFDGFVKMNEAAFQHLDDKKRLKKERKLQQVRQQRELERAQRLAEEEEQRRAEEEELAAQRAALEEEEGVDGEGKDPSAASPVMASTDAAKSQTGGKDEGDRTRRGSEVGADEGIPEMTLEEGEEEEDEEEREARLAEEARIAEEEYLAELEEIEVDEVGVDDSDSDGEFEYESNAFCITLFCIDEQFESRASEILAGAFELYPDKDYCIITMPHTTSEIPVLDHFTMVEPKPTSTFSHVLYFFHRYALIEDMKVRMAKKTDEKAVIRLCMDVKNGEEYVQQFRDILDAKMLGYMVFVNAIGSDIISMAIVQSQVDIDDLVSTYSIEDFLKLEEHKPSDHMYLRAFVCNPVFEKQNRFFFSEIFRLFHKTTLYYELIPGTRHSNIVKEMVQVRARRKPELEGVDLDGEANNALFFTTRRLLLEPKVTTNARVVVVGASDTGISFLETLVMIPYLRFSNLILVSPGGFVRGADPHGANFRAYNLNYSRKTLNNLALDTRVRVIDGKMVNMDRGQKTITIDSGHIVPYDHLVITAGLQDRTKHFLDLDNIPLGYISLSTEQSEQELDEYLESFFLGSSGQVIVYGGTANAYCCIQGLIDRGVDVSRIVMIQPPVSEGDASSPFAQKAVQTRVMAALEEHGIDVHTGLKLVNFEEFQGRICAANFNIENQDEMRREPCHLLVSCDRPNVDIDLFDTLNDHSLVYDGRFVVDNYFRTVDPYIRSAGSLTKFAKRFRARYLMEYYNSKEIGVKLAATMLPLLDPLSDSSQPENGIDLPKFSEPVTVKGVLPGGYQYIDIESRAIPSHVSKGAQGRDLITETPECWCRIRVSAFYTVDAITCIGSKVEESNLLSIVDLPATYLNNLVNRFDEGLILDLIGFLRESWAVAVYHDHFKELRLNILNMFKGRDEVRAILSEVHDYAARTTPIPPAQLSAYRKKLKPSTKRKIQTRLVEFLRQNANHLPMYLAPYVDKDIEN